VCVKNSIYLPNTVLYIVLSYFPYVERNCSLQCQGDVKLCSSYHSEASSIFSVINLRNNIYIFIFIPLALMLLFEMISMICIVFFFLWCYKAIV